MSFIAGVSSRLALSLPCKGLTGSVLNVFRISQCCRLQRCINSTSCIKPPYFPILGQSTSSTRKSKQQSTTIGEASKSVRASDSPYAKKAPAASEDKDEDVCNVVLVKGLPWLANSHDIRVLFEGSRIKDDAKGIHLLRDENNKFTGKCYIEMTSDEDAEIALRKDKSVLWNRYIEVSLASSSEIIKWMERCEDGYCVCVLLPYALSHKDVENLFGDDIDKGMVLMAINKLGTSTGKAYVQLKSKELMHKALERNMEVILPRDSPTGQRLLKVSPARRNEIMQTLIDMEFQTKKRSQTVQQRQWEPITDDSWHVIELRGLPYGVTKEDICKFFYPHKPISVTILRNLHNNRPTGNAQAKFESHVEAVKAMGKDKCFIGKRFVDLYLDSLP